MSETFEPTWSAPPGDFIAEEMAERGLGPIELSRQLGWHTTLLERVLDGRVQIREQLAADLSRVFGTSAEYWLNLQRHHDQARGHGG